MKPAGDCRGRRLAGRRPGGPDRLRGGERGSGPWRACLLPVRIRPDGSATGIPQDRLHVRPGMDRLIHSKIRLVQIPPPSSARPAHTPVDGRLVQPPVRASPDPLSANPLARSDVAGVPGEVTSPMCCPQCPVTTPAANGPLPRAFVRKMRAGRARGPARRPRCGDARRASGTGDACASGQCSPTHRAGRRSLARSVSGQVPQDAGLGLADRLAQALRFPGRRGEPARRASRLRTPAIRDGARGALPGMALEQLRRRVDEQAMSTLLGPARSSARSRARPAAAWSPTASCAIASSSRAATTENGWTPAEPSMTGASAAAACGSCWASRNDAKVARISGSPRSCSSSPARAASTRSVWPGRSSICSMCARIGVARMFGVTSVGASRSPAWKSASASS